MTSVIDSGVKRIDFGDIWQRGRHQELRITFDDKRIHVLQKYRYEWRRTPSFLMRGACDRHRRGLIMIRVEAGHE